MIRTRTAGLGGHFNLTRLTKERPYMKSNHSYYSDLFQLQDEQCQLGRSFPTIPDRDQGQKGSHFRYFLNSWQKSLQ